MRLKLKRTPGIYLVGFMACGKSTVGRRLAERIGWTFVDIDEDIELAQNATINQIFDTQGEEEFRKLEAAVIVKRVRLIQAGKPMVLAVGGGSFVQQENFELLENNGVTIWLDCPLDIVQRRVGSSADRPLARDPQKLKELFTLRKPLYSRADHRIEICNDDADAVVERILQFPLF